MVQRTSDQLVEEPEHQHTNRLINETSPYLLQHAHNPVDWYPWGEAAFRAAREQDKPIFLSVGYSTCYWCHVMERESFENEAIAAIMNEHFINIKVDREERPDVDDIYMTAVQLITRQGGWPMSVWLEPEGLRPIIGGTYFPPQDSRGRPGFPSVLRQIADAWATRRDAVVQQAEQVAGAVRRTLSQAPPPAARDEQVIDRAIAMLMRSYDRNHGGFSGAPKFPTPVNLEFLIAAAWERDDVRQAVTHTLNCMALGGMYDQIGGGFHRYSVDEKWLVPHFEKMLYDNGQLLSTYAESYERTDDAFYARVLRRTCEYVQREMTGPGGGFHSAQDAEVDSREGLNYLWTEPQIRAALAEADLESDTEFTLEVYGFTRGTNFRDPHHPSDGPKNVVFLVDRPESLAAAHNITVNDVLARLDHVNEALRGVRDQREQPGLDDKILAGWNGLMIAGFADAGRVLDDPSLISAAERAAAFVLEKMRGADGSLQRTYRQQEARIDAFLEDYAFLVHGLLALHRATDDTQWLTAARELAEAARTRFHDDGVGGFFDTLESQQDLFVRTKGHYDGAVPSGNGQMVRNLVTLHERTGEPSYRDDAVRTLRFLSGHLAERPIGMTRTLEALVQLRTIAPNAAAELESSAHESATPSPGQPVALSVDEASLEPIDGGGVRFALTFDIGEGYHINARDPGQADLVPLAIEVDGDGVELRADYPSGESYGEAAYATEPIMIHRGTLRVPITLRRIDAAGPVRLVVTWQACTDEVCLQPQTQVIELAFDPAD